MIVLCVGEARRRAWAEAKQHQSIKKRGAVFGIANKDVMGDSPDYLRSGMAMIERRSPWRFGEPSGDEVELDAAAI